MVAPSVPSTLTMTLFSLEDTLSETSAAGLSTSSEFIRYILENKIPEDPYDPVHPSATTMTQPAPISGAGSIPRLVDGAHEAHIIPGHQLMNSQGWSSHNVVMKILQDQGESGDVSSVGEELANIGESRGRIFHSKCLAYLEKNGHSLMKNRKDVDKNCSMLLHIADNVKILPPPNDPLPWDILNMTHWKATLNELIKEMKTVEEKCPLLICNPSVYVLTKSPYGAFLRAFAAEIADACESKSL